MNDSIISQPATLEASFEAQPAGAPQPVDAAAVLKATIGVTAALDAVGPRLTPPLRAAVRAVLLAHAAPAAIAGQPQEGIEIRPEQFQPHPIDTKGKDPVMKPRNQRNKAGNKKRTRTKRAHLSPRWQIVYDALPDQPARAALMPLITLCHALLIEPDAVNQSVVVKLAEALRRRGHPDPASRANSAIKRWTALMLAGLALPPLQPIDNERSRRRAAWKALPRPLRVGVVQYLRAFGHIKLSSRRAYRVKLRRAIGLLVAAGRTPQSVADLTAPATIDFLAAHPSFAAPDRVDHNRRHMLDALADLARHHKLAAAAAHIRRKRRRLWQRVGKKQFELAPDRLGRLAPFDRPAAFAALIGACAAAIGAFAAGGERRTAYPRAQAALAILLILATCKRRDFIAALAFDGPPRQLGAGSRPTLAHPQARDFEARLRERTPALIDAFYVAAVERLGRAPLRPFEVLAGAPRDASSIGKDVKAFMAELGYAISISEVRILALKLAKQRKLNIRPQALAGLYGYRTSKAFAGRFRPLLAADASVRLADALKL
jgi:uncharacterized protein YigA (DUF484 family)